MRNGGVKIRVYVTHCSAAKDDSLKDTGAKVTPDRLYRSEKTLGFIDECKAKKVRWAIFSDKYGVWFPDERHEWYEKAPSTVTEEEFENLVKDFEQKLGEYDEIWFYHNPSRFHSLYKRLLKEAIVRGRIVLFTHKDQII